MKDEDEDDDEGPKIFGQVASKYASQLDRLERKMKKDRQSLLSLSQKHSKALSWLVVN